MLAFHSASQGQDPFPLTAAVPAGPLCGPCRVAGPKSPIGHNAPRSISAAARVGEKTAEKKGEKKGTKMIYTCTYII